MNEKAPIQTLHVASFTGNVGDNANHNGTRRTLAENTGLDFKYTESEIRRYYQNYSKPDALAFDEDFVATANEHELVLIGSGNFFELWIEESATGTTIDMQNDIVDQISTPMVFYGLGCDPYKGIPGDNQEKFQSFLEHILQSENCLVSVRNDGSISHIKQLFGDMNSSQVKKVPDGGFFTQVDDHYHPELREKGQYIALNVVIDMADLRFPNDEPDSHSYETFIEEMAEFVDEMLDELEDLTFVLMPHIYSDLTAISDLLSRIEDFNRRSRIATAPYLNGEGAEKYLFDIYRKVDLAMGMRFHTNVCSIGQHTPSIGFISYPKVGDLYRTELDMPDRTIDIRQRGFSSKLAEKTKESLNKKSSISNKYKNKCRSMREDIDNFHAQIETLLEEHH